MNTTTLMDVKPTTICLTDGGFQKNGGKIVQADGRLHGIVGDDYVDEQSITVASDHLVKEVDRIRGKLAYMVDYVVSPDGSTLTSHVASYTSPGGQAVQSTTVQRRIGEAVKGAHPVSGEWKRVGMTIDTRSDWLLTLDGNRFSWRTDAGSGYDAVIGGRSVKIDGDNSGARARITRPRPDIIVETDLSPKGGIDDVLTMRLMPDGMTIRATALMPRIKTSQTFSLRRLPE